jgi:vesicle-fusing ATPase
MASKSTVPRQLKCAKLESARLAYTNLVYVHPQDFRTLRVQNTKEVKYLTLTCENASAVFSFEEIPTAPSPGEIMLNSFQRSVLNSSLGQPIQVVPFWPGENDYLDKLNVRVKFANEKKGSDKSYKSEQLEELFKNAFLNQVMTSGHTLAVDVAGVALLFTIQNCSCVDLSGGSSVSDKGILLAKTGITFAKAPESVIKISGAAGASTSTSSVIFGPNFNFEQMGIGGLDKEFASIFRRAFASRVFPAEVVANLGIRHVKGILLHGPPGTGKTLIARKIGKMLNAREPKIVNGPEILNKYVGQSEENIRALFAEAEREEKAKGPESELHIIIFDELDAICKERGSTQGGTGVGDSIVNQLLAKLDGVDQLNNILVIGMTNRKDMIDEALLRPGRLEVHMEIGLPDEAGRVQIFNIHTTPMRLHNYIDPGVDIKELAVLSKNYSGAEIEGLVKSAASFALNRQVDAKKLEHPDPTKIKVTREDFLRALNEVKPAFGVTEDKLSKSIKNGIIPYSVDFQSILNAGTSLIRQVEKSSKTPLLSCLLSGNSGSGKTALACKLAMDSGFPFVKCLFPEDFIAYNESSRATKIQKAFQDAYKSELSLIVVDDIERFIEYSPLGQRYSNTVLQTLLVLFKTHPPKDRRLMVIGTTSNEGLLEALGFMDSCDTVLHIPSVRSPPEVIAVLQTIKGYSRDDLNLIAREWQGQIEIKKLVTLAEMALASQSSSAEPLGKVFLNLYRAGHVSRKQNK